MILRARIDSLEERLRGLIEAYELLELAADGLGNADLKTIVRAAFVREIEDARLLLKYKD